MSQLHINTYRTRIAKIHAVSGSLNEGPLSAAFASLIESWGRAHDLTLVNQWDMKGTSGPIRIDGALVPSELRVPFGYWEAKDSKDVLDTEIAKKIKAGYPQDNIVYEDTVTAVLIQDRREVDRVALHGDDDGLKRLLARFFAYERPEIAEFRAAAKQFRQDLPVVLAALREATEEAERSNATYAKAAAEFLEHARSAINPAVSAEDIREMLLQHILTEEIFTRVFDSQTYHRENNVAKRLDALEQTFFTGNLRMQTVNRLKPYYNAIKHAATNIPDGPEKQKFLKSLYEGFYKVYNPKAADRLGVVYTPGEIVRFMIRGADWLCETHFGRNLIDSGVEILDPATGTGTFIVELLEHFAGDRDKLRHKYKEELHANEVAILPYYVANLNIEATFAALTGQYAEFPGLVFVDTLDNTAGLGKFAGYTADLFGSFSDENIGRIKRQNERRISVIIGNPPYNANQQNENDNNKNRSYPRIDARIRDTYIKASTAQKTKLYDMYARFFRWASDRLKDEGVVAFITNRSFIDARGFDGFRRSVIKDFGEGWVIDLGGDYKRQGSAGGGNVFDIGTGVAISFWVKRKTRSSRTVLRYFAVDAGTKQDKLAALATSDLADINWTKIADRPDAEWTDLPVNDLTGMLPIADRLTKTTAYTSQDKAIFKLYTLGVSTNRDDWLYDRDRETLASKARYLIDIFGSVGSKAKEFPGAIKWSRNLKRRKAQARKEPFSNELLVPASYRPFSRRWLYQSPLFVDELGFAGSIFPPESANMAICFSDIGSRTYYCVLAINGVADLHFGAAVDAYQQVSRYRYLKSGERVDNITDWAVARFRERYSGSSPSSGEGDRAPSGAVEGRASLRSSAATAEEDRAKGAAPPPRKGAVPLPGSGEEPESGEEQEGGAITKDSIFAYVYAALHDPVWRTTYAADLRRSFPRIPLHDDFARWAAWGQALLDLHIGYETATPFDLARTDAPDPRGRPPVPKLKSEPENGVIILDSETRLSGVPRAAWDYRLGNRSAIDWVLDQHKEKTIRDPTVAAKFNTYRFADHKERVIALLARVVTVSVETVAIVEAMRGVGAAA